MSGGDASDQGLSSMCLPLLFVSNDAPISSERQAWGARGLKRPYASTGMMRHIPRTILFLLVAAFVLGPAGASQAQHGGRLVIWRVATLGYDLFLSVSIDGRHAADLPYGHHFDTVLPPGRHVIFVEPYPKVFPDPGVSVVINVRPGDLFNFTTKGSVRQLYLSRS